MAALQKIRSKGVLLACIIGLALFAFIAEEAVRSIQTTSGLGKQQVGSVYGEKLSIQDYQKMVEVASEIMKIQSNTGNLTAQQTEQVRQQVWNQFVEKQLIYHEADALGLKVTDEEVQNALVQGTANALNNLPFFQNQQGKFDYIQLQNFLKQYKEMAGKQMTSEQAEQMDIIKQIWDYTEQQLRDELLAQKYITLVQFSFTSNPTTAKFIADDANTTTTALVASVLNSTIDDKQAAVSDEEIKELYGQYKKMFEDVQEARDVKYIDVAVTASDADRAALDAEMEVLYNRLVSGEDKSAVVNSSKTTVRYTDYPVSADVLPYDIRTALDSIAVGTTTKPSYNAGDNTLNIISYVSKTTMPDSILYRMMPVIPGEDDAKTQTREDSILNALKAGANFRDVAKNYQMPGDSVWFVNAGVPTEEVMLFLNAAAGATIGAWNAMELNGNKVVYQIMERKAYNPKHNVAVVKVPVDFSAKTYQEALNKFNMFVGQNKTLADIEKNAPKAGYLLRDAENFTASPSGFYNIGSTKDAVRWIFDEADEGDVSPVYECGDNNDHILLVGVKKVHEKGYREVSDPNVKKFLTQIVKANKKSAIAYGKLSGVKTIEQAQGKGAVVDTVSNINFLAMPVIASKNVPEPLFSAVASKLKAGQTSAPFKGGNGAYIMQVVEKKDAEQKIDEKQAAMQASQMLGQRIMQSLGQVLSEKAEITDNRYKF